MSAREESKPAEKGGLNYLADLPMIAFDAIVAFDTRGRITFWNPAAEQVFGWTAREVLRKPSVKLFWPQSEEEHRQRQSRLERGETLTGQVELRCKDGSSTLVEYRAHASSPKNGNSSGSVAVFRVIAPHNQTQREISLIARMPAENPNPVMRLTPDGQLLYGNLAGEALLEFWQVQTGEPIPGDVKRHLAEAFASGSKKVIEAEMPGKVFALTLMPLPEAGYINLYGSEITELKQAQEALRQNEKRLATTYTLAPIGIVECSTDGRYINVNEEFCRLTGYARLELLRMSIQDLTHEDDYFYDIRLHERLVQGRIPYYKLEKRYICKDGTTLWVEVTRSLVRGARGEALYSVGAVADITERKRADQSLAESARQQAALFQFTDRLHRTTSLNGIFNAALDAILGALRCDRASILLCDNRDVMRFVAWRGLSDEYRKGTDGHSPWKPDVKNPEPIGMSDIATADLDESLRVVIQKEGIGALAFIPLVSNDRLIGKFMVYFDTPHVFHEGEIDLSLTIARQLAFGIERKRAEEAVRASETLYRSIARSIPGGGVYVVDKDMRYIVAEGPVTEAFGLTRQKLEGYTVAEAFPDERGKRMEERLRRSFAGETISFETNHEGRVFWTQQAPLEDSIGQVIIVTIDITERKQAEEALRQSEERFARFMQYLPGLAWIKDGQGRYIYANAAAEEAFNIQREQLYGRTDAEIFPADVAAKFRDNDEQAREKGRGVQVIETLQHNDGVLHYSLVSKFPIPGPDGRAMLIGGTGFDITDRILAENAVRERERQLRELNETLEQKVKARTEEVRRLASDLTRAEQRERDRIAHFLHDDLQQRLYAIQMQMTFLHGGVPTQDPIFEKELAEVKTQLDETVALTRRISIDLSPPILQDEGLTQAIIWLASQMREQHGLKIDLQSEGSFAIPDSELQVLLFNCVRELLFNVVKHAAVDQAHVSLQRLNTDLQIQIRDNGKGFDTNKPESGNGGGALAGEVGRGSFGLPTIRRQLSLFGGRMDVQSAPGAGTQITLILPAFEDAAKAIDP